MGTNYRQVIVGLRLKNWDKCPTQIGTVVWKQAGRETDCTSCQQAGFHTGFLAWGGGISIGASMKRGNVRGGVGGIPLPPPEFFLRIWPP